jgi:hypothetical protein
VTAFTGSFHENGVHLPHDVTPLLDLGTDFGGLSTGSLDTRGAITRSTGVDVEPHAQRSGSYTAGFGGQLFEKVLVFPRKKSLGFVLSDTQFNVEVWNAYRNVAHILTALDITGAGDLSIDLAHALPLTFWPYESFTFLADIPQDGAAAIANLAVFTFEDIDDGTDLSVDGSRLAVLTAELDWGSGFGEQLTYKTAIIRAHSDMEQRVQLRTQPRPGATFRVVTLTARDTAQLTALIYGRKASVYGVPMWQDAQPLLGSISEGALVIAVNTTDRGFVSGGLVMVWAGQHLFEALTIDSTTSGTITLRTGATKSWPVQGTRIVPLFRGRLLDAAEMTLPGGALAQIDLAFSGEVV